jgi:hypothetical protein
MKGASKPASASARSARSKHARSKSRAAAGTGATVQERLAALERERDQLREELEHTRVRQRQLEEIQAQVRDRLAWALDSLHNILEGKG